MIRDQELAAAARAARARRVEQRARGYELGMSTIATPGRHRGHTRAAYTLRLVDRRERVLDRVLDWGLVGLAVLVALV